MSACRVGSYGVSCAELPRLEPDEEPPPDGRQEDVAGCAQSQTSLARSLAVPVFYHTLSQTSRGLRGGEGSAAAPSCAASGIGRAPTRLLPLTQSFAPPCPRRHACDVWQATRTSWVEEEERGRVGEDECGERRACIACLRPGCMRLGCACIVFAALPACCTLRTDPSLLDAITASCASERAATQIACNSSTHTRPAMRECPGGHAPR